MLAKPAAQLRRVVSFQDDSVVAGHALCREDSNLRHYRSPVTSGAREQKEPEQQRREINTFGFGFLNHFGAESGHLEPRIFTDAADFH